MTQEPLLYLAGASEGTTQWKAETLQMVNWGGFQGPNPVTFAPGTTLLSGASGTGKSTLLDAYLALMMPSDTQFNGASNDATLGRARNPEQRNLISYLRGKTDTARDSGTNELKDQVLRGQTTPTWGGIAMTFIDDNQRRYTAMRLYYVPRNATVSSQMTMKMATIDGHLDLRLMEPLAETKFDKRSLKTRFPTIHVHDTYSHFAQTLYTRLGIGANGDGAKALRLLARIQAGHQVRTVDDLYKSLVIEEPPTFAAADHAVEHFANLEASYDAMVNEAEKEKVLARLPELHRHREAAVAAADLIDTFGITREDDSPFLLWKLTTLDALLETAEEASRTARTEQEQAQRDAHAEEDRLDTLLQEVRLEHRNAGGEALDRIDADIERLNADHAAALTARQQFDTQIERLTLTVTTAKDFNAAQKAAQDFVEGFEVANQSLNGERTDLLRQQFPLAEEQRLLVEERTSLQGRQGRVPPDLHEARVQIAHASGLAASDLPFVAELIDVAPEETRWRKAIETHLHGLARVLLIDEHHLDRVSRAIDSIRLRGRINFEGITLADYEPVTFDPDWVSGKLRYQDSPFTRWVQNRISSDRTDALCVESAAYLNGPERRITLSGQARQGKRGAHGDYNSPNVIGFSNKERLAEIETRLGELVTALDQVGEHLHAVDLRAQHLIAAKSAHETVLRTNWDTIDHHGITERITALQTQRQQIVDASGDLNRLEAQIRTLDTDLGEARRKRFRAENLLSDINSRHERLITRKDNTTRALDRLTDNETLTLSDDQNAYLNTEFAKVTDPTDLDQFDDGIRRLRQRLAEQVRSERDKVRTAEDAMTAMFDTFLSRWPDPNLTSSVENYPNFRDILDNIVSTGLHERRREWSRRLTDWSGQDLVPLAGAFDEAVADIRDRLDPINNILAQLPFGARRDHLYIDCRAVPREEVTRFRRDLSRLSSGATTDFTDAEIENWFRALQKFMNRIRKPDPTKGVGNTRERENLLDVRKHVEITAVAIDDEGNERSTYAALGGKSGGETQELVAFIVGAALRYQLGDEASARPRFAPVFLDEGFVKSDSEFAGRAVAAWKGLGFQLIIGAPLDKVTALEPHADLVLGMVKSQQGFSRVVPLPPTKPADQQKTEAPAQDEGETGAA